jgi:hypothetical protein
MSDYKRLRELALYIAEQMEKTDHVARGRVKLAKLLWRADFAAYWLLGDSITGTTYVADKLGPKPEDELILKRDMEGVDLDWENEWDKKMVPIPRRGADLDAAGITPEQKQIVDEQLEEYRNVSAKAMADEAHEFFGWKFAWECGPNTIIPYESVYWDERTEAEPWEIEHAASLVA